MTKLLLKYFPASFIIIAFMFIFIQHIHKPRILILHSAEQKNDWIQGVDKGINNIFSEKEYLYLRRHYMDIRDEDNLNELEKATITANEVIAQWHPDLIIAFGRRAQNIVSKYYINDPNIKIVFGGISNQDYTNLNYQHAKNVTGVIEDLPYAEARDIFSTIFKDKHKFYYLSDSSDNSKSRFNEFSAISWAPFNLIKENSVSTFILWQQAVKEANKNSDLLIIRRYAAIEDENHQKIPPQVLINWTLKFSKIPVIGISSHFVRDGGGIGIGANAELNGEDVAKLALDIIDNKKIPANIPVINNTNFIPYLRESELKREVPNVYIPTWYIAFAKSEHAYY